MSNRRSCSSPGTLPVAVFIHVWNDRFGEVECFPLYCNVIVFIQIETGDSKVSESLNVPIVLVLCSMPKYNINSLDRRCRIKNSWKKLQNSISRNLKLISHSQCNTENWLKIPNQNVVRGPIKNMQSREAGEADSVLSRDVSQVMMWRDLWDVKGKPVFPHYPWCARRCVWVWVWKNSGNKELAGSWNCAMFASWRSLILFY